MKKIILSLVMLSVFMPMLRAQDGVPAAGVSTRTATTFRIIGIGAVAAAVTAAIVTASSSSTHTHG